MGFSTETASNDLDDLGITLRNLHFELKVLRPCAEAQFDALKAEERLSLLLLGRMWRLRRATLTDQAWLTWNTSKENEGLL